MGGTPAGAVNWENVEKVSDMEAAARLSCLLRKVDLWHKGNRESLRITYNERVSIVEDTHGNAEVMEPEEWKGIVLFVHSTARGNGLDALPWQAFGNDFGLCGIGGKTGPRFDYEVKVQNRLTLEVRTLRNLEVAALEEVPPGLYEVRLQFPGETQELKLHISDNRAKFVESASSKLKGLEGKFEFLGNGVFRIELVGENHRATQSWVFHSDGTASVKEVPDLGEKQTAVRVDANFGQERKR